jgi:aminopeptidase N
MIARAALENPDITWAFALDHLDALNERLDALQRINFVPSLGARSTEPRILGELRQFIDEKVPVELRPPVNRFYADLQFRLQVRAERVPEIDEWLTKNRGTTAPKK